MASGSKALPFEPLDKFLQKYPDLASVMFVILGTDLADKLTGN